MKVFNSLEEMINFCQKHRFINNIAPKSFTQKKSKSKTVNLGSQDLIPFDIKHAQTLNF